MKQSNGKNPNLNILNNDQYWVFSLIFFNEKKTLESSIPQKDLVKSKST